MINPFRETFPRKSLEDLEIAAAHIGAAVSTQCRRRVFVSAPEDKPLTAGHKALKDGVIEKIKEAGYFPEMFNRSEARSFADGKPWSLPHLHSVVSRCVGAVIIGLPREVRGQKLQFTSELCHLEGGVAYELDIPLFVLADEEIKDRGIFKEGDDFFVVCVPREAGVSWLETDQLFCRRFDQWLDKLEARYDVFLGYCGCASRTASLVKGFLSELGVTVLDWKADFAPSNMILDQIRKAAARCSSGVFLFTKDDPIESDANQIAPRDNVVFEAGFFCHAKGQQLVLIIREKGAKMPADLGGNIFATLDDCSNIEPIKGVIRSFLEKSNLFESCPSPLLEID